MRRAGVRGNTARGKSGSQSGNRRFHALRGALLPGLLLVAGRLQAADLLARGNDLFRQGKYDEAVAAYESDEEGTGDAGERLTRRFNAGVSLERAGKLDEAVARFEEVSVRGEGKLRAAAFYNAGCAQFERGKALARAAAGAPAAPGAPAAGAPGTDERAAKLAEAARAYHASLAFFRKVEPPDDDTTHNIAAAKTALRAALDEIARAEDEKRRAEEDEALKSPPQLLRALQAREKLHRRLARELVSQPGPAVRLGARRLRRAEQKNRELAEKLAHKLEAGPAEGEPQPGEDEKTRQVQAGAAVKLAVEAMRAAEVAYSTLKAEEAAGSHGAAIADLRAARQTLAVDLPALVAEAIETQTAANAGMEDLVRSPEEKAAGDGGAAGAAGTLLETLEDKLLQPLARLLQPRAGAEARALAEEEDDVVWAAGLLSQAEIPPPPGEPPAPPPPAGQAPQPGAGPGPPPQPQIDPQMLAEINASLEREGKKAHEEAGKAKTELEAARVEQALPSGKEALAALERLRELLPKPPATPEERLRRLIERQVAAKEAAAGLPGLAGDARNEARRSLEEKERADGKEAGAVAAELEKRQDDRAAQAAPKVHQGEGEVFSSAEALRRERLDEAPPAIDRARQAFEEALALLGGQEKPPDQGNKEEEQKKEEQQKSKDPKNDKEKQEKSAYQLSAAQARREQQEMDKKRREEEAKIFSGSSDPATKDW